MGPTMSTSSGVRPVTLIGSLRAIGRPICRCRRRAHHKPQDRIAGPHRTASHSAWMTSVGTCLPLSCPWAAIMGSFIDRSKFLSGVANAAFALARTGRTHRDVFLVLDGFGHRGRAWRETDEAGTDRETLIRDLIEDQYENPVRIVAFNTAEGWSRDVTIDIADELRRRYVEVGEVPDSVLEFMEINRR